MSGSNRRSANQRCRTHWSVRCQVVVSSAVWLSCLLHVCCGALSCFELNKDLAVPELPPLPKPVINLSFPRMGTRSLHHYFECGGWTTSHVECESEFKYCGSCIENAVQNNLPPLKSCGGYDAFTQIDITEPTEKPMGKRACYWPQTQMKALKAIHDEYPEATFVMTLRNTTHWVQSMSMEEANKHVNMKTCGLIPEFQPKNLYYFYCRQVDLIRRFVDKYPSHALVEIDVEDQNTRHLLEQLFGISEQCWGHFNADAVVKGYA